LAFNHKTARFQFGDTSYINTKTSTRPNTEENGMSISNITGTND